MFFRTNTRWAKLRRIFSVDAWMVKLLGLSVTRDHSARPGTVVIQIDGLSHTEFDRAIQRNEMPHLKMLLKREGYKEYRHYSGQPSSTPAVQGELFYGVKGCVPAFNFKDKITGRVFNMFNPAHALKIESRIKNKGAPLLKGGSAYGDIFTGGAREAHFCVSAIGWGPLFSAANPLAIIVFVIMHLHIIFRAGLLTVMEFVLALVDSIRGSISGKNLLHEITYIPFRVIACVIMREVIGVGAKIDIARGVPVIHMNFAGYDEQSHHRGPGSGFAHWSLRAIDSVIRIVWKAAKRSPFRDYDVIVYSDHGQEEAVYYGELYKRPVQEAINELIKAEISSDYLGPESVVSGGYLKAPVMKNGTERSRRLDIQDDIKTSKYAVITALGPVGHIYLPGKTMAKEKAQIARALATYAKIPMTLVSGRRGMVYGWNAAGKFSLPRDAVKVLGASHPFLRETARDLVELCNRKDAGDIVFCGMKPQGKTVTFYNERGSHGGPGINETSGFAIFPPDISLPAGDNIDNIGLRSAVLRSLGRGKGKASLISKIESPNKSAMKLKIMSYNVHSCKGRDGKISPERIAKVIAMHNPDIIALQEIDARNNARQAKVIARLLSMNFYYHSNVMLKSGFHGNAVLSRFDMKLRKRGPLPNLIKTRFLEQRGALWVEINAHGRKIQVFNTHLSLFAPEGMLQAKHLLGKEWLGTSKASAPLILCGDLNARVDSRIYRAFEKDFRSVRFDSTGYSHLKAFAGFFPRGRVDHIFLGKGVKSEKIETPGSGLEKIASDHLPLIAEVLVERGKL